LVRPSTSFYRASLIALINSTLFDYHFALTTVSIALNNLKLKWRDILRQASGFESLASRQVKHMDPQLVGTIWMGFLQAGLHPSRLWGVEICSDRRQHAKIHITEFRSELTLFRAGEQRCLGCAHGMSYGHRSRDRQAL
jgi:hypothetical protein